MNIWELTDLEELPDDRKNTVIKIYSETGNYPKYGTEGSAAFDIEAKKEIIWKTYQDYHVATVDTGLYTSFSSKYVLKIYPRSGLGFKFQMGLANTVGIIDSDYRGEIVIKLVVPSTVPTELLPKEAGSRIAQAILEEIPRVYFKTLTKEEFENEKNTERGEGGFGSTGI
jgi:dUTP pyrophosphatase